ncbi:MULTISPECIES: cobalamin biosynthesis protein [unclassified Ruegeria]|uniref:cobalamin biosynthesis protein n=1 Tax=unclassified Ruegeria TaxID=2625375 RepID=UPI0014879607|nr:MULTISPECIES: cobalamin biosynthesis protein [unclassified Ruegeria]NOD62806.1 precorrin methylase [Ruegeria sp. HKCCD6109]NOD77474.1 precorrin methylase [Ruegeria sp. HKCCD4332]NOD87918.1 precorrin methylase [Ruegeria sp. HKCCD4318]NOE14288.1 precorrin methylase [Ruegeria sp. HKCCD4318-2]NOG08355.1 cobalamin biosynthesis protein [Ruegeria sp. HKCCD4315]
MIVAGLGFSSAATEDSLREAFNAATANHDVAALATVTDKEGHSALTSFAEEVSLPVHFIAAADLAGQRTLTCSTRSRATYGTGSVAEASALAAAEKLFGLGARLLSPRQISDDRLATCAIAIGGQT